jgi:hypothetical protein
MEQVTHILICGRDVDLLETRGLVLQSAGFRVSMTLQAVEKTPGPKM